MKNLLQKYALWDTPNICGYDVLPTNYLTRCEASSSSSLLLPPPYSSSRLSTAPLPPLIRACKDDTNRNTGTAPANKTPLTGLTCWSVQVRLSESIFHFLPRQPEFVQRLVLSHLLTGLQRDLKTSHWVHYFRHGLQRGLLVVMDFLGHTIQKFGMHALDSFHLSDAASIFLLCKTQRILHRRM